MIETEIHSQHRAGTADLLLSHGYCLAEDEHERTIMMPYPPLGLLYLSSHLKARGFAVEVHDSTFSTLDAFTDHLEAARPRVVGLYCTLMTKVKVLRMVAIARAHGALVVLGGPEPAPNAAEYLAHGAHVVVVGEGERTLEELLRHLPEHGLQGLERIRGLRFLDQEGELRATAPRPLIHELSTQPWPDRGAVDLGGYLRTWRQHHGYGSVSLMTSRGCPFTCAWCSHDVFGRSHRRRSVEDVADEVLMIAETWTPERLWFADDVFTLNRPWVTRLSAELSRRSLRLPFECISRADRLNEEVADALAEMGCFRLWIGSESGSQKVLDRMQRRTTVEDVQRKTAMLQARGIEVGMFIMLGYEGEEQEDLEATVEHLKTSSPDIFLTTVAYPIRGTDYHHQVEARLRCDQPWAERTDRDLRISGRHSRRYFRHATRWMVNEVYRHRERSRGTAPFLRRLHLWMAARWGRLGMWLARNETEEAELQAGGRGWGNDEAAARERAR